MTDVIMVLGMHRSGTSAVAGVFTKLGGGLPKHLMAATPNNTRGYFESSEFMRFHDALLASAGSNWRDWRLFNPEWRRSSVGADFRERAKDLFAREFEGSALPVLKDPRICRFAPFWLEVLREMQAPAHIVMPIRPPLDVARSLGISEGLSLSHGLLLWLRHVLDAEASTRREARSLFTWQEFRSDWRGVCNKIAAEAHIHWPRQSDRASREIERFLTEDLVHHDSEHAALVAHPDMHEWAFRAHGALLELARSPSSNSALATLDEVRLLLDTSSKLFGRVLIDYEEELAEKASTVGDLQSREHELAEQAGALAQLTASRDEAAREKEALALAHDESERKLAEALARLESARGENAELAQLQAESVVALERVRADETKDAARVELAAGLDRAQQAIQGFVARFEHMSLELQRTRDLASDRDAAVQTANEERVRALRGELVDAEAALARAKAKAPRKRVREWLRSPSANRRRLAKRLLRSGLFDAEFYRTTYPAAISHRPGDGTNRDIAAAEHYLEEGFCHGFRPNALFDTRWYLDRYDDVRRSGVNPLLHYLVDGFREGRDPGPEFSTDFYLGANPDTRAAQVNPLAHYLRHGRQEGRLAAPPMRDEAPK